MHSEEHKLLRLCGYALNPASIAMENQIRKNYSQFDAIVTALEDLAPILQHSDFYLSLQSSRDLIKIKNDMVDPEDFLVLDADIIVWANEHNIELEEGLDAIAILGFRKE
ncbi:MAG: hypothetical protein JXK05_06650 [Campylobacterales bacterium]|nr:hypothetical protein [Campylobacterales bacterium]